MKILSTILFLLAFFSSNAQATFGVNPETKLLTAEEIIQIDSLSAERIYQKSKEWVSVKRMRHVYDRIEADDPASLIRLNYVSKYYGMLAQGEYWNVLTIQIKDGKAKIIIDNILLGDRSSTIEKVLLKEDGTQKTGKNNMKLYEDIKQKTLLLITEIKAHLIKKENW